MGATVFSSTISARTAGEAYRTLVEEARYESGNDGYSGTIAETHGFKGVAARANETVEECVERITDTASGSDAGAKRGPAACLDLGPDPKQSGLRRFVFFGWAAC